ncbi:MAG: hypothetical protein IPO03_10800 [Bacteroidetes bacterium]|nr:hypothetical protein [Bacteroidota bacterium]
MFQIAIKIVLTILFLLCLLDMPYGYFQIVRFAGLVGFGILAFQANENKQQEMTIVFIGLALLFQPFLKIALGRQIWNIVDVIVSIFLIATIFIDRQRQRN